MALKIENITGCTPAQKVKPPQASPAPEPEISAAARPTP